MKDTIELTKALVPLAWPLLLTVVLWKLFPTIRAIANSRSFSVKVAGMEVSVQDATEQLRVQISDLQKQVIELRQAPEAVLDVPQPSVSERDKRNRPTILWVDDKPSNNAMEIAQLQEQDIEVVQVLSTEEAMAILHNTQIDAVISDMGRRESGNYRSQAGLLLLNAMRRAGIEKPFMVYSSAKYAQQNRQAVMSGGGDGATDSPIELIEWLRLKLGLRKLLT